MDNHLLHTLPMGVSACDKPTHFISPYTLPPHPIAQQAARETIDYMYQYMASHPQSELLQHGKMFGVLVVQCADQSYAYLRAFSALLDSSYIHEGFVPPIFMAKKMPIGTSKEESQRLQRLLFADFQVTNSMGHTCNLLDIFASEKHILTLEEWTSKRATTQDNRIAMPPSGAGECCAPKLLQYAIHHQLTPIALAEFWVGASPTNELRQEGFFYAPCSSRCVPILRHLLEGMEIDDDSQSSAMHLCAQIEVLYEDDYLIVINKPAGLLSVAGKGEEMDTCTWLQQKIHLSFLQAAHRLDQDTSGLLILAKEPTIYKQLQSYFQRRDILKRYEAVIMPLPHSSLADTSLPAEGTIELPLLPNPFDRPRQMVNHAHGKVAITRYYLRSKLPNGTLLVDFYPLTGRTHQLRVHAAHIEGLNAPIVGDRLYGQPAQRLMLHAAEIKFIHPITKEEMHFCIPSHF